MGAHVIGLVHKEGGNYGISFPDFPGCVSAAPTLDEAVERGRATLAFHVEGMVEDGDPLPRIRTLEELRGDSDFRANSNEALVVGVPLDLPGKSVRLNISLDERLVEAIDRAAVAAGHTRSGFLADAAKTKLRGAAVPKPVSLKLRINGVALENARPGKQVSVLTRAVLTSDTPEFYLYMHSLTRALNGALASAGLQVSVDRISVLVLVTHADGTAGLFLEDVPFTAEILAKKDFAAGDVVYQSGIADVRRIRIPGIDFKPDDGALICFKVGWKFALFFDLAPKRALNVEKMERDLARLYRLLLFQDVYEALSDSTLFASLLSAGWFPFVEIIGGEFEDLLRAHRNAFNVEEQKQNLIGRFDASRIDAIAGRWAKNPELGGRMGILRSAADAYKRGDPVACLKIILTELEGIIQDVHIAELGKGAQIKELLKYAAEKGVRKTGDETSLLFPSQFLRYLSDYTYAYFDPKNPSADTMSRHSVGHGGARPEAYTLERALLAILTLDQLAFYL